MSGDECEFDSTWEDGDENKTPRKKMSHRHRSRRNMFAAKDMRDFRHSCRGLDNISDDDDGAGEQDKGRFFNLEFYRGKLRSSPDDLYITDFHQKWWGEYDLLEDVHSYIQWLFPIQEPGVNWRAHVLSKKEIKLFRKDKEVKKKLVVSYKLMLDFYGIRLVDKSTGEVERAPNWEDRFRNLNRYTHNNLRITRILKCLGTLGLKHYQAPLVKFFLNETLVMGQLQHVKQSALDYFMFTVLDKSERRELVKFAFKLFKPREHFVWGPKKILSGQVAHCKNENMDQPTENKQSSIAEDQQKRADLHESKHKINKIDANHPPEEMESKKDNQNKDETVMPNKLTETNNDQGASKNYQCRSENEGAEENENQDLSVGVSEGDGDGVGDDNKNIASCHRPDIEMEDETEDKDSEDEQKRVNFIESTHEINKIDANHPPDKLESIKDNQNKDEPVIPNKLTETNSDQGANKSIQCSSENEDVVKQNHEMSVSDNEDDNDGDGVDVSDDNENTASANESHGHDAIGGSHQTEEGSSCQVSDTLMKDDTKNKESEDKQKGLNPHESKHKIEKTEASHSPKEVKSKKDHQNKNEPVISNILTETNSDQRATDSSQCSSVEDDEQNDEMSVDDGVGVSNDNKKTAPVGHDAASGSRQIEEGPSCQVQNVEMKDETENKHEKSENEQ